MRLIITGVVLALVASLSSNVTAQNLKVGYANMQYILKEMPESKTINSEIETFRAQLTNKIQAKYTELQTKLADYEKNYATLTDLERQDIETELQQDQQRLEKFQQDAEVEMQKKQTSLLQPAFKKIIDNIKLVAEEKGLNYVFQDNAGGAQVILYASDNDDISDAVLLKMGIKPQTGK